MPRPELSLVIPIFNEEEVLPRLEERLLEISSKLPADHEVVFVDDGSKDKSLEILRAMAEREPKWRVASFSRNFGHQRAITAGMDFARGRAVVIMDADLQDPPEVITEMLEKFRAGYDVVYGRRRTRAGETAFKVFTAKIFYRVFATMIPIEVPLDTGDFRLVSRRVVLTMRALRETHRFVRGLVAWAGFKQTAVEYDRAARAAGETKYPLKKMLAFAIDGIASFSILPLRAATYIGVLVGVASILYGLASVLTFLLGWNVPGWTTTVVLVSFLFSVQLLVTGVLGEYVGRIYEQVKQRPLYVVAEKINWKPRRRSGSVRPRQITESFGDIEGAEIADAMSEKTDPQPAGPKSMTPPPLPVGRAGGASVPPSVKTKTSPQSFSVKPPPAPGTKTASFPPPPRKPSVPPVAAKPADKDKVSVPPPAAAANPSVPPTPAEKASVAPAPAEKASDLPEPTANPSPDPAKKPSAPPASEADAEKKTD